MDFPEPLSGMLRNFDWDAYIQTAQSIPIDHVERNTVPYLFTNDTGTIKVVGFIRGFINSNARLINKFMFDLHFVINENGSLSRNIEATITNAIVYPLPDEIYNEMLLANTIYYDVFIKNPLNIAQTIEDIRYLVQQNKTDYLKLTYHHNKITPLMFVISFNDLLPVVKELIKYYVLNDLYYRDAYGHTVLYIVGNNPVKKRIIEDAIKEKELETFLYASKNTGITAENIDELSKYFIKGGKKKSKKKRNKKRDTKRRLKHICIY